MFIIEDDDDQIPFKFDEELTVSVSDWYHKSGGALMDKFLNRYNPTGAEPIPQNSLFNDTKNVTWLVKPDTTYFMRIVNMGLFVSQYLAIEDHKFTITGRGRDLRSSSNPAMQTLDYIKSRRFGKNFIAIMCYTNSMFKLC